MERTPDCYFVAAIVESKEGDMLLSLIVLTNEDSRVVVRLLSLAVSNTCST